MRKFTENLELPSEHKIGDKVILNFYDAGELIDCEISEVHFNESDVSYDIIINVRKDIQTIIKTVDAAFIKKY